MSVRRADGIKAVTLDVAGTLIHCPAAGQIYAETLRRHALEVEASQVSRLIPVVWQELDCLSRLGEDRFAAHPGGARGWWQRFLERLCEHLGTAPPSPFAAAELFERFARADAWQVFPEVEESLADLSSAGLRLAVISNFDDRLPQLLARLGLARWFEAVVYSAAAGSEKPHPEIFHRALAELELPPAAALHVGDRRRDDLEGALAVGMKALLLDRRGGGDVADLTALGELLADGAKLRTLC